MLDVVLKKVCKCSTGGLPGPHVTHLGSWNNNSVEQRAVSHSTHLPIALCLSSPPPLSHHFQWICTPVYCRNQPPTICHQLCTEHPPPTTHSHSSCYRTDEEQQQLGGTQKAAEGNKSTSRRKGETTLGISISSSKALS